MSDKIGMREEAHPVYGRTVAEFTEQDVRDVAEQQGLDLPDLDDPEVWERIVDYFNEELQWNDVMADAIEYANGDGDE